MIDTAVIPAGGSGLRALPSTANLPKPLLGVAGRSLLQRNIELVRDGLAIKRIIVITGVGGEKIEEEFAEGGRLGVDLAYVPSPDPEGGLATGMLGVREHISGPFAVVLGDEFYLGSRHDLLSEPAGDWVAVCAVRQPEDPEAIASNYRVVASDDRVIAVEEKPIDTSFGMLGLGSWLFTPEIFEWIDLTEPNPRTGQVELVDSIRVAVESGRPVFWADVGGKYVNVNTVDDHRRANEMAAEI